MAVKQYKPTSPGRRDRADVTREDICKKKPEKRLSSGKKLSAGRNNRGRITTRGRAGGNKKRYRQIDFYRNKDGVPAKVAAIEYDPNRTARIALLHYVDGEKRYIIAPQRLQVGDKVVSGDDAPFNVGNAMTLSRIPTGMSIHNIEMIPGCGASLARSAGNAAMIRSKEADYVHVRLPSGEMRMVPAKCRATIGKIGNVDHERAVLGKAGRNRHRGRRPKTRGVAQNPVDHPMGGGEGRTSGGGPPVSKHGQLAKGFKTRDKKKSSSKFIIQRRTK